MPRTSLQNSLATNLCFPSSVLQSWCKAFIPAFVGINEGHINEVYTTKYMHVNFYSEMLKITIGTLYA